MKEYLVTSESVTEGHPDKICDQISDGILDAYLEQDPESRVAVETMISPNTIMIAGEVTSKGKVDIPGVAREIVKKIGYTQPCTGFDCHNAVVLTNITSQSPDIARGVNSSQEADPCGKKIFGAGDQGMMYGYACDETEHYLPITIDLAHRLVMKLAQVRKDGTVPWLYPDGKSQVTMKYSAEGKPLCLTGIIVSAQHSAEVDHETVYNTILQKVIQSEVDPKWMNGETKIYINQTGRFVIGGPAADVGLTGRKIMVDTYGGVGKHGGGAFSGKDPTKVDRSAAYMARYAAKNIVAAKLAAKCEVSLAYAIGVADPVAVTVNTFGTERIGKECIDAAVRGTFSFSVADILEQLNLKKPQFLKTAAYGHFGREDQDFQWEKLDKVQLLQEKAIQSVAGLICN